MSEGGCVLTLQVGADSARMRPIVSGCMDSGSRRKDMSKRRSSQEKVHHGSITDTGQPYRTRPPWHLIRNYGTRHGSGHT